MKVAVVGAGAVGQVFGWHLRAGGAQVAFHVKPEYADTVRAGLLLHPMNGRPRGRTLALGPQRVTTTPEELADFAPDQVWLCVSASTLGGDWLPALITALGEATLVTLQPGLDVQTRLLKLAPGSRLVIGAIGFLAWQTPLMGDPTAEAGVGYWFPPLSPSSFSGDPASVNAVLEVLKRGRCPARQVADAARWSATSAATMIPPVVALEACSWSFRALADDAHLADAARGVRQALVVAATHHGDRPPRLRGLIHPWTLRLVLRLAPHVVPFDLEAYVRYHFTKTSAQTRGLVADWIQRGEAAGQPVTGLRTLAGAAWGTEESVAETVQAARNR